MIFPLYEKLYMVQFLQDATFDYGQALDPIEVYFMSLIIVCMVLTI